MKQQSLINARRRSPTQVTLYWPGEYRRFRALPNPGSRPDRLSGIHNWHMTQSCLLLLSSSTYSNSSSSKVTLLLPNQHYHVNILHKGMFLLLFYTTDAALPLLDIVFVLLNQKFSFFKYTYKLTSFWILTTNNFETLANGLLSQTETHQRNNMAT